MSADAELAKLERQVLGVVRVSSFLQAVDALRRMLATESPALRAAVLKLTAPAIGRDLAAAIGSAWNIGIRDASGLVAKAPAVEALPPKPLVAAARAGERFISDEIAKARKLAKAGADLDTVMAPVNAARARLRADVSTLVTAAGNAGSTAVADAAGLATVWIAETNACVECLAYSGVIAKPGRDFPGGLTYGAKSYNPTPIAYPPRHPNCRCTVEPLRDKSFATALRREADRSVLRGFSLESESMKTRIDAADRLVAKDPNAPASVIAYARRAVKAGKFPTRGRP